jgi:hypothetical protein
MPPVRPVVFIQSVNRLKASNFNAGSHAGGEQAKSPNRHPARCRQKRRLPVD